MSTGNAFQRCGTIALLLTLVLGGWTFAQDSKHSRSSQSLRSLLGLPGQTSESNANSAQGEAQVDELEDPLLIPANANRDSLPSTRAIAPLAPRYEFQDTLRSQTQQQLENFMRPISEVSLDIREADVRLPRDRSSELQNYVTTDWTMTNSPELAVWWAAPNIRYGQLYFENVALERYGQTCGPYKEVTASAAHLFCSVWGVPFQMWTAPAGSCDTPLGYCRPGSNTDLYRQRFILWR
ncbi:MAG: hypothetical protein ACK56J_06275 [Planctomycetota bacterium]|jgi:hypothetical protein|nr:hypothetical protein [Blastopirellula sp.]